MKKCIMISDSFKGSISSTEIGNIAKDSVKKFFPDCEVISIPVADGGEGTVDCFLEAVGGEKITVPVKGPLGDEMTAPYAMLSGNRAVIEMAAAAGLPLVRDKKNPKTATTFGVGTQIKDALSRGAEHIILGLGGSATNDGGCGCAAALGVKFYDEGGREFIPAGGTLEKIAKIDVSECRDNLRGVKFTAMCDIDNPLYGENGAAYIFGPQKGADENTVLELDRGLRHLAEVISRDIGADTANVPGAGAAGGFGAGAIAFFGAELMSGIEVVLDAVEFDRLLENCDMVFTGEGRIDGQSLRGKVVIGVAGRTKKRGVPCIAIVGDVRDDAYCAYDMGVTAIFSTNRLAIPFSEARGRSRGDYVRTFEDVMRIIKAAEKIRA